MRATIQVAALLAAWVPALAGTLPDLRLVPLASGFQQPVHMAFAPGSGRAYVVEQGGLIRTLEGREPGPVFLDIRRQVESGAEKGLLSVAFHPAFPRNRRFFVNYTTRKEGGLRTQVSAWTASPDLLRADPSSERVLLDFAQPYANHNGGLVVFGPDGFLYVGVGDGGAANDPHDAGQRLDTWLGKILRLDVDRTEAGRPYGVPPDNPFVGRPGARPEIFAYGLRNPWRFSFDRADGTLWCGDVGQNAREEIDVVVSGGNYGWRTMEGFICTPRVNPQCVTNGLLTPVVDYPRSDGVSVTGGHVYRGRRWPGLEGVYVYGDFATGHLWGLRAANGRMTEHRRLLSGGPPVASFAEDADGELYVVGYNGTLYAVETAP